MYTNIVMCISDCRQGFGLEIGFSHHLTTQLVTTITSNYSAFANLHTLQITTAPAKFSPACCVLISRSLITASNSGNSSACALRCSLNDGSLKTVLTSKDVFVITTQLGRTDITTVLLLLQLFPWERVLFAKDLPRNDSGIFAYLAVVA
jgi:hypothetical protein